MILELGKVSVETKGLRLVIATEVMHGQVRPYEPSKKVLSLSVVTA